MIANILRSQLLAAHNKDSLIRRCVSASRFGNGALYKASLSTQANDSGSDRDGNIKSAKFVYIVGGMGSGKVCVCVLCFVVDFPSNLSIIPLALFHKPPNKISRDLGPRSRFLGISTMAAAYLAPIHVLAIMVTIERICSIKLI